MAVSAHCLDLLSSFHEAFPDCYRESLLMYSRTFSVDLLELTPQAGTRASSLTRCSSPMCLRVISVQVQLLSSVQLFSRVRLFATPWTIGLQASLSITSSRSLLKLTSVVSMMPSNHLILCRPLLLPPSIFPSIRVFSNESALHIKWPKYWSFSFSISPSNEYSGLISFRMDWLDLLAVQGTLKSLLQHHSSKASILQCSAFFMVQLSHHIHT